MSHDEILCRCIQEVKPSGIRRLLDILEEMKDATSLGMGEPDFVTPWHIRDAGIYSLEKGFTKYASNAGMAELRREIAAYLNCHFGPQYGFAHQIVATVGGSEAINLALRCIPNPDDEVIIPVSSSVYHGPPTSVAGDTPVYAELKAKNELRLTAAQLRAAFTPRTKAVVLPFPSNPIGGTLERADLEVLVGVLRDTNAMALSDEIYAEPARGQKHVSPVDLPELYDRTIVVNGFSRSHAMTSQRMGYVCDSAPIPQQMLKLHQFSIMSAPTTSQYVAIEAMRNDDVDIERMRDEYGGRRRYLAKGLRRIGPPCFELKGAFYVSPDTRGTGLTSDEFCERFLTEEKVAAISGSASGPGGKGLIRCYYVTSMKDIVEALTRMDNSLTNSRKKQAREG